MLDGFLNLWIFTLASESNEDKNATLLAQYPKSCTESFQSDFYFVGVWWSKQIFVSSPIEDKLG